MSCSGFYQLHAAASATRQAPFSILNSKPNQFEALLFFTRQGYFMLGPVCVKVLFAWQHGVHD